MKQLPNIHLMIIIILLFKILNNKLALKNNLLNSYLFAKISNLIRIIMRKMFIIAKTIQIVKYMIHQNKYFQFLVTKY